ncbi:MAG: hypothetical protein RL619_628, partial [Bacteroidota bacterium]
KNGFHIDLWLLFYFGITILTKETGRLFIDLILRNRNRDITLIFHCKNV